jgi:hypothetical protein
MRELLYTMHYRGQASRSGDDQKVLRTTCSGTSCVIRTIVESDGLKTSLEAAPGDMAFLEAELHITSADSFEGKGTITFGDDSVHELNLKTSGAGHWGQRISPEAVVGTVTWRIESGQGQFGSATGYISSTFTLNDSGDLSEYHCGLIFLPG